MLKLIVELSREFVLDEPVGLSGWILMDKLQFGLDILRLASIVVPGGKPHILRLGSDAFHVDSQVRIGPQLPSHKCHLLTASCAGSHSWFSLLPVAVGNRTFDKVPAVMAMLKWRTPTATHFHAVAERKFEVEITDARAAMSALEG